MLTRACAHKSTSTSTSARHALNEVPEKLNWRGYSAKILEIRLAHTNGRRFSKRRHIRSSQNHSQINHRPRAHREQSSTYGGVENSCTVSGASPSRGAARSKVSPSHPAVRRADANTTSARCADKEESRRLDRAARSHATRWENEPACATHHITRHARKRWKSATNVRAYERPPCRTPAPDE